MAGSYPAGACQPDIDLGFGIDGIATLYLFVKKSIYFAEAAARFIPANIDEMAVGRDMPRRYTLSNLIDRIP